jgi:hypothetical protein
LDGLLLELFEKCLDISKRARLARRCVESVMNLGYVLPGRRQSLLQTPQGLLHLFGGDIWCGEKREI